MDGQENFGLAQETWEKLSAVLAEDPNVEDVTFTRDTIDVVLKDGSILEFSMDLTKED